MMMPVNLSGRCKSYETGSGDPVTSSGNLMPLLKRSRRSVTPELPPSKKLKESYDDCPSPVDVFPLTSVHEMMDRIRWIETKNEDKLEVRFKKVFRCRFVSSTYHKHKACWKWLMNQGFPDNQLVGCKVWSDCVKLFEKCSGKREKGLSVVD